MNLSPRILYRALNDQLHLQAGVLRLQLDQRRNVHHHKEWEIDKDLYMGLKRSNPQKANRNVHVSDKRYKKLRGLKTLNIELPDDVDRREQENMAPDQIRISLLKKGINPYKDIAPREWKEHQLSLQSFYSVLDPYVTDESAKSHSWTSLSGLTGKYSDLAESTKGRFSSWYHGVRRIKKKVGFEKFDPKTFGSTAESIYVSAYMALIERNKRLLQEYITEHAFVKLWPDVENGTVVWNLVEFKEPSKVISIRCSDHPYGSGNDIAQLTVRMHSTQVLAIYDRFGHLLLGSETERKDCLEYVVFENHVASIEGKWRFHDKVYPHWLKPKQSILRTELLDPTKQIEQPIPLKSGYSEKLKQKEKKQTEKEKLDGPLRRK